MIAILVSRDMTTPISQESWGQELSLVRGTDMKILELIKLIN